MNTRLDDAKAFVRWLVGWFAFALVFTQFLSLTPLKKDDSDPEPEGWGRRSGIQVRTDSLTGCQYLETTSGGITPRVDGNGRHVGCNTNTNNSPK